MVVAVDDDWRADRRLAAELAAIHAVAFANQDRHWSGPEIHALLSDPVVVVRVAYCERRTAADRRIAAGFAFYRIAADEAELLTLAIVPECWRNGLGTGLLAACEDSARASDATRMFLEVAAGNTAAGALYYRAGYRERGRRKGYYLRPDGRCDDAVVMAKRLFIA